ncbi:hypothetical protein MYMA111404_03685 [Mycoplasma marinum]|uniref:DUF3899 domain-containing protein n=2 Tax=Mycoplasma marinum TaxID=1937190 RepID=A0A4R0XQ36_9MOLU|nr:hypothetical protein C4B24_03420 [Mycoplasma marinum]
MKKNKYNPNRRGAKQLAFKRLKRFFIFVPIFLLLELLSYLLIYFLSGLGVLKYAAILIVAMHILVTLTYMLIFDFGAAKQIKKADFVLKRVDANIEQNQTFYVALRYSGFARLLFNVAIIAIHLIFVLIVFFV